MQGTKGVGGKFCLQFAEKKGERIIDREWTLFVLFYENFQRVDPNARRGARTN